MSFTLHLTGPAGTWFRAQIMSNNTGLEDREYVSTFGVASALLSVRTRIPQSKAVLGV